MDQPRTRRSGRPSRTEQSEALAAGRTLDDEHPADAADDRRERRVAVRPAHVQTGDDRHEEADTEQRVEDRERLDDAAEQSASVTPSAPLTTVAIRATGSTRASSAPGFRKRLYRSCENDVVSMKSTASAALTSAEKTAASAIAPTSGGSPCTSTIGSARFGRAGDPETATAR